MSAGPNIDSQGTELARYGVADGERVLMGWRTSRGIEVTDVAVEAGTRGYVVDRGFGSFEQLKAFIADYLEQAERHRRCPMDSLGLLMERSDPETVAGLIGAA